MVIRNTLFILLLIYSSLSPVFCDSESIIDCCDLEQCEFQDPSEIFVKADLLIKQERPMDAWEILQDILLHSDRPAVRSEAAWMSANAIFSYVSIMRSLVPPMSDEDSLEFLEEGEALADLAITLNPRSHQGYFWRAACKGQWMEIRSGLSAFAKAGALKDDLEMSINLNPDYEAPYEVLSILLWTIPGWPISFGNKDESIALARKYVILRASGEDQRAYGYALLALAEKLRHRNLSSAQRERHFFKENQRLAENRFSDADLAKHYEGTLVSVDHFFSFLSDFPELSDQQEAKALLKYLADQVDHGDADLLEMVKNLLERLKYVY